MTHLFYRSLAKDPTNIASADGIRLRTQDGRTIIDSCGGACVANLGYRHPRIRAAMKEAADSVAWVSSATFITDPAEALAEHLASLEPRLPRVILQSGGTDAVELALKLAYQWHCERGEPQRVHYISRRQSYHGHSLFTLALSGQYDRREMYKPILPHTTFVSDCNAYRGKRHGESDDAYGTRLAQELDNTIQQLGPDRVAAFLVEPVTGSTAGAVPPVEGYLRKVHDICKRHGVLLIIDEVMSGLGRVGRNFTHEDSGICPDMVTLGKGLAAGYQPISAIMISDQIHQTIAQGSARLVHPQTQMYQAYASRVALEVQRTIADDNLVAEADRKGQVLRALLRDALGEHDHIGDIRGMGLFLGVEIVKDRDTKAPLSGAGASKLSAHIKQAALENGLLTYPAAGTIDGVAGNHVLFAPPFVATDADLGEIVDRFVRSLSQTLAAPDIFPLFASQRSAETRRPLTATQ